MIKKCMVLCLIVLVMSCQNKVKARSPKEQAEHLARDWGKRTTTQKLTKMPNFQKK